MSEVGGAPAREATRIATRPESRAGVSVVLPAYDEGEAVGRVVAALRNVLDRSDLPHEVVVVDDGSTDDTAARAERAGARVLAHRGNRGYGAALKTGIRHARHPIVCIVDADLTYPVERIPELVRRLTDGPADMVVGDRSGSGSAIPRARRPAKWVIGRLGELVAGESIPDLNSGLRAFRRDIALQFFSLLPDGFSLTTTITLAMLSNGYLVEYVPVEYRPRVGRSKIRPVRDTLGFLELVLRIALYFAPLKVFVPLSATLMLIGLFWGATSFLVLGELADTSTLVILMTSVQVAAVGLLAELIDRRVPSQLRKEPEGAGGER